MNEVDVQKKLKGKAPTGYRLNEIIHFSYPIRHIKLNGLVNKKPDDSLGGVYTIILRAIDLGMNDQQTLFKFLGLSDTDEFISRELYLLREKGLLDLVSNKWMITEEGHRFIEGETIIRLEEQEELNFLIDGISGEILSHNEHTIEKNSLPNKLEAVIDYPRNSNKLIKGRRQELADVYKKEKEGKEYLISYDENDIKNDYHNWLNFWLIEYTPIKGNTNSSPKLEVRTEDSLKLNKRLTSKFNNEYRFYIYQLTDSDRANYEEISEAIKAESFNDVSDVNESTEKEEFKPLSIWETKQYFIKALKSVKNRILIESPWIKRATQEYIPYFEKNLELGKQVVILYGIGHNDEHDFSTVKQLEKLNDNYKNTFHLIHLPSHLGGIGDKKTGTHRKLVVKDDDYYISGSFNFLSFGKNDKQQVANEESHIIYKNADKRWHDVLREYGLTDISVHVSDSSKTIQEGESKKTNSSVEISTQKRLPNLNKKLIGKVKNIRSFGVIVEFDNYPDAILHKNKLLKNELIDYQVIETAFKPKTSIAIEVVKIENTKINVSLDYENPINADIITKLPSEKPFAVGASLQGKIKNIQDYGVFISFDEYPSALLHKSRLLQTKNSKILKLLTKNFLDTTFEVGCPIAVVVDSVHAKKAELVLDRQANINKPFIDALPVEEDKAKVYATELTKNVIHNAIKRSYDFKRDCFSLSPLHDALKAEMPTFSFETLGYETFKEFCFSLHEYFDIETKENGFAVMIPKFKIDIDSIKQNHQPAPKEKKVKTKRALPIPTDIALTVFKTCLADGDGWVDTRVYYRAMCEGIRGFNPNNYGGRFNHFYKQLDFLELKVVDKDTKFLRLK